MILFFLYPLNHLTLKVLHLIVTHFFNITIIFIDTSVHFNNIWIANCIMVRNINITTKVIINNIILVNYVTYIYIYICFITIIINRNYIGDIDCTTFFFEPLLSSHINKYTITYLTSRKWLCSCIFNLSLFTIDPLLSLLYFSLVSSLYHLKLISFK